MKKNQILKYAPTAGDVHVNTPLTNISIAYLQNMANFVSAKVFPNIPVTKQSDRYFTYDRGEFNRDEMEKRAPGTESAGGSYTLDNTPTYYADVYAFHKDIPDQIRANSDSVLAPDREATEYVSHKAMIKREKLWATKYFATGIWTTDNTAANWGSAGTATDPIVDIRTGKRVVLESTGFEPNTLVLSKAVYDTLADNADIIERVNAGQTPPDPAMGTIWAMMALFEISRIFIMKAIENTAKEGLTPVHSFIGGAHALLCYSAPSPGIMTPTAGYTFSWTGFMGAGGEGNRIKRFRQEHLESDRVEIQMAFDQKLVAADLGYFFDTPIEAN
jgi:hypothetical protein